MNEISEDVKKMVNSKDYEKIRRRIFKVPERCLDFYLRGSVEFNLHSHEMIEREYILKKIPIKELLNLVLQYVSMEIKERDKFP